MCHVSRVRERHRGLGRSASMCILDNVDVSKSRHAGPGTVLQRTGKARGQKENAAHDKCDMPTIQPNRSCGQKRLDCYRGPPGPPGFDRMAWLHEKCSSAHPNEHSGCAVRTRERLQKMILYTLVSSLVPSLVPSHHHANSRKKQPPTTPSSLPGAPATRMGDTYKTPTTAGSYFTAAQHDP